MSFHQKIFMRVLLLTFLLIAAISTVGIFLEIGHRSQDNIQAMQNRLEVLSLDAESLGLHKNSLPLNRMIARLGSFNPSVKQAFVEQNGQVLVSSGDKEELGVFLGWANTSIDNNEIRTLKDNKGVMVVDLIAPIGINKDLQNSSESEGNATVFLHVILNQDSLAVGVLQMQKAIVGMGLLAFLLSIPGVWVVARLTTHEVNILTTRLSDYGENLEDLVVRRTATLRQYEGIISSTNDHISFLDSHYIYRAVNQSYLTSHNKSRDEIVGKSVAELLGEDTFQKLVKTNLDHCLAGETIKYQDWFDFDGLGRRFMDVVYDPFLDDGNVVGVVVSSRDLTLLQNAQDSLRETEERYRSLFDGISNGVAIYSAVDDGNDFVFLDYNAAGQAMDQTTKEEAIGKKVTEVFPQMEKFGLLAVLQRVYKTGISESLPVTVYEDDKVMFWRQNTVYKLPSGELVAVYSDETKRMQAEEVMRNEHARFVAVLESLDAAVYVADMTTHELLFANNAVREQFGNVIGKTCWKSIQTGQTGPCEFCTNDRLLDAAGAPKNPYIWEFQNTVDGLWYQCHDQAIQWPDGRIVRLEIATDITQRKKSEEELKLRGRNLKGLSDAAHVLLGSRKTIPLQDFVDAVGPSSNAGRAYIFMNHMDSDGQLLMSQKAEWCAPGIKPEFDNPLLQGLSYDEWMPNWKALLMEGETINRKRGDFSPVEQQILDPQGIKAVLIMPIFVENGFVGFLGLDNCISEREWGELEVTFLRAATSDLAQAIRRLASDKKVSAALEEKDVLLREIHHRVKNNMQVITSLLNLQARKISDEQALAAIRESQDRIHVMSLVHESLYRSNDLRRIAMDGYFNKLIADIARVHGNSDEQIRWRVDAGSATLSINEAIPIGLIANELISNAFKHAFPSGKKGNIELLLHEVSPGEMQLVVSDDGQGMPEGLNVHESDSLGLQLVSRLAQGQLGGSLVVYNNSGTRVQVTFTSGLQEEQ